MYKSTERITYKFHVTASVNLTIVSAVGGSQVGALLGCLTLKKILGMLMYDKPYFSCSLSWIELQFILCC
jgi:uncharacterized membrane protein